MSNIYLDRTDGVENKEGYYSFTYKVEDYSNKKFKKLTISFQHRIKYSWTNYHNFYLYIYRFKGDNDYISYFPGISGSVAHKIEALFSKLNPDEPLVLGFRIGSNSSVQYFSYESLKGQTFADPPNDEIEEDYLLNLLKNEDEKVNKLITFRLGTGQNQHIKQIPPNLGKTVHVGTLKVFKKVSYLPNTDTKFGGNKTGPWEVYNSSLFTKGITQINDPFLKDFDNKNFKRINVYWKKDINLPLLVEFIEDYDKRNYCVRKDLMGYHWEESKDSYDELNLGDKLQKIYTELSQSNTMPYHIERKQSYGYIQISIQERNPETGFTKYTHNPSFTEKMALIFYNGKRLNDEKEGQIGEIENKIYSSVVVYYCTILTVPLFLYLDSNRQGDKSYYVHKRKDTKYYWENNSEQSHQLDGNALKAKLREIKFNLIDSVIILTEKQQTYGDNEINKIINGKEINRVRKNIHVTENKAQVSCLKSSKYRMFQHNLGSIVKSNNCGIRLFVGNQEVHLYSDSDGNNIDYIFQQEKQNYFYIYFQGNEKRPLLFFYNNKAYKPQNKDNYHSKWIITNVISPHKCSTSNTLQLVHILNEISEALNPVKIDHTTKGSYVIHNYGPGEVKINLSIENMGYYVKYTHTQESGLRLGNIMHGSTPIIDINTNKPISASSYNDVVVFYHQCDKRHKNPILITLESFSSYSFYYRLSDASNKKYSKVNNKIQLIEGELKPILDPLVDKVFNTIYLNLHEKVQYKIQRIGSGTRSQQDITIFVSTKNCDPINNTNYKCYSHNIRGMTGLGTFKIKVSSNIGVDLYLNSPERKQSICYINGKNEVSVFFYGQDPRPLLFCYKDSIYKPNNKEDYCSKWVKTDEITSRNCCDSDRGSLKRNLDEISNDLNPVNIAETNDYSVHEQWPSIKINVDRDELTCYYKYTHTPKAGCKLGKIVYINTPTNHNITINGTGEKSKITVYYYKHDTEHSNPLLLELELKSTNTTTTKEYYELKQNGGSYKWAKCNGLLDLKEGDDFESKLIDKLFQLNEKFNSENEVNPKDAGCKKHSHILEVTVSTVSTAIFGGGTGFLIYKYGGSIIVFITKAF